MTTSSGHYRRIVFIGVGTLLHVGLTIGLFRFYVQAAMEASHGNEVSTFTNLFKASGHFYFGRFFFRF